MLVGILCFQLAILIWELASGTVLGKGWQVWVTKEENPRKFWVILGLQSLLFLTAVVGVAVFICS